MLTMGARLGVRGADLAGPLEQAAVDVVVGLAAPAPADPGLAAVDPPAFRGARELEAVLVAVQHELGVLPLLGVLGQVDVDGVRAADRPVAVELDLVAGDQVLGDQAGQQPGVGRLHLGPAAPVAVRVEAGLGRLGRRRERHLVGQQVVEAVPVAVVDAPVQPGADLDDLEPVGYLPQVHGYANVPYSRKAPLRPSGSSSSLSAVATSAGVGPICWAPGHRAARSKP